MININQIAYPYLLIENNHLNFYKIEFDNSSLSQFIEKMKKHNLLCNMVDNICSTQEFTEYQKEMMSTCFPNLKLYSVSF